MMGLIPGLIIVFFILNQKGAKCSGYLPNSRVIAETLSKDFKYSEDFKTALKNSGKDQKFLKDSIITNGLIDFKRSNAQKQPCPEYILIYPEKNPKYEVFFTKCKEAVTFNSFKSLR